MSKGPAGTDEVGVMFASGAATLASFRTGADADPLILLTYPRQQA